MLAFLNDGTCSVSNVFREVFQMCFEGDCAVTPLSF
jgi:hypothetical protein